MGGRDAFRANLLKAVFSPRREGEKGEPFLSLKGACKGGLAFSQGEKGKKKLSVALEKGVSQTAKFCAERGKIT